MSDQNLDERLNEIEVNIGIIKDQQGKILNLLSGNPINRNDTGLLGKIAALEEQLQKSNDRISKLEKWKERIVAIIIGVSFGAGWGASDLLSKLFFGH